MKYIDYFSYKKMVLDAKEKNCDFSVSNYVIALCIVLVFTVGFALLYQLWFGFILLITMISLLCMPLLLRTRFSKEYKRKQFCEVDIYIHQMAYSFKRFPKINQALEDTITVTDETMKKSVMEAAMVLNNVKDGEIYKDALSIIEKNYVCLRIKTLHRFLISIEEKGGNYENSLNILIMDFDRWVKRVYKYQEDVKRVQHISVIGIIMAFIMGAFTGGMTMIMKASAQMTADISDSIIYQSTTVIFFLLNILYFLFVEIFYNYDWLDKSRSDYQVMKDFKMVFLQSRQQIRKYAIALSAVVLCISGLFFWAGNVLLGSILFVMAIYLFIIPTLNKKNAMIRLREDIYMGFSEWLRDVALNLQNEPLMVAIEESYEHCPLVMKPSLNRFIYALENNPMGVQPYYDFLHEFNLPDVSAIVRTLYAMGQMDKDGADLNISTLIARNYELLDQHELIRNKDSISMMRFGEYIPTLFVSLKIAVDIVLVITEFL